MTNQINPLDTLFPVIASAVEDWRVKIDENAIKQRVKKSLDAQGESLILKLLGFSSSFGGWDVDHCNGRSGESAVGDYFKKLHQQAIQDWLKDNFKVTLTEPQKKKIVKQATDDYVYAVSKGLRKSVEDQADKDVTTLIAQITSTNQADNYLKVRELLSQTK